MTEQTEADKLREHATYKLALQVTGLAACSGLPVEVIRRALVFAVILEITSNQGATDQMRVIAREGGTPQLIDQMATLIKGCVMAEVDKINQRN